MSVELTMLAWAAALAFVQMALYAVPGVRQTGVGYALSPRDEDRPLTGFAGRARRAYFNHLETLPLFTAAVVLVELTQAGDAVTAFAAQLYLGARAAYVPAYVFGVPWLRSLIWTLAVAGILILLVRPLMA